MTAAHKAAKSWYDARAGNDIFVDTEERREFREDMVRRLSGHLEPFFKAEVERVAGPLAESLEAHHGEFARKYCTGSNDCNSCKALENYRKEMSK